MGDTLQSNLTNPTNDLERTIADLGPWFHNVHLPGGVQTAPDHPLGDFPRFKWQSIAGHIPRDLTGWNVLDVGCNAGFYAFELARRGAVVTGLDSDDHYLRQARWLAGRFDLQKRVKFLQMGVYELARVNQRFDLVWFMGVFYHLRYPLLALDILAARTGKMMVFQTLTQPGEGAHEEIADLSIHDREPMTRPDWPKMAFVEHRLAGDPTNWWVANHAGVEAMLRSVGMKVLRRPGHEIYICQPDSSREDEAAERDAWLRAVNRQVKGQL